MSGQTSNPSENASRHLDVETAQSAVSQEVVSGRSTRFLWTGLGFAGLMLIGVTACVVLPVAPHASAQPARLNAEVAFMPGVPGLRQPIATGLRPAVAASPMSGLRTPLSASRRQSMSTLRMSASGEPAPDLATPQFDQEEATDLLLEATNSAIALQKGKAGDSASLPSMPEADKTQSRNWLDVLADHGGVDDQKILRRGTLASLASMALFGNAGAALAAGRGGGGGRSGGRVGGRAPSRAAARPAPRAAPAPAPRTNVYVTPPRSTNVYVNPGFGGGYGYGGGFGYGGGVFGGGPGLGTYLGLSFAESLLRQQQRREMLDRELRTQQELGRDQGQIQALQQQLAAQDASIAALKAKGDTGTAPAQGQPAKSEQQQMLEMKELLLKQQQEIIDLKKDKK